MGAIVWASLVRHVIEPLHADYALLCSGANCTAAYGAFARRAVHVWARREPQGAEDWGSLLALREPAHGAKSMGILARTAAAHGEGGWGLTRGAAGERRHGSGSAILETHAQLLDQLRSSGTLGRYDWFVVTRSDMYFLCDHPPMAALAPDAITVPSATIAHFDHDGRETTHQFVHDEFAVVPRQHVEAYLTTARTALGETARRDAPWCGERNGDEHFSPRADHYCAMERLLGGHLERAGVRIVRMPMPLVLVREVDGAGHIGVGAVELPSRVHHDLRCMKVAFGAQYQPAVDACTHVQGRAATAFNVISHLHYLQGADLMVAGLVSTLLSLYCLSALFVCLKRR